MSDPMKLEMCDQRMAHCADGRKADATSFREELVAIHRRVDSKLSANVFWTLFGVGVTIVLAGVSAQVWNIMGITKAETQIEGIDRQLPAMTANKEVIARNSTRLDSLEVDRQELNKNMLEVLRGISRVEGKLDGHMGVDSKSNGGK